MTRHDEVLESARGLVGGFRVVADCSWALGLAVVVEIETSEGEALVVKGHATRRRFDIEVAAYRDWVPSIADRAPALRATDHDAMTMVMTRLDGDPFTPTSASHHDAGALFEDAGRVLRRWHDQAAPVPQPDWCRSRVVGLDHWVDRAPPGLLADDDVEFARTRIATVLEHAPPDGVVCHGDWQPRNWIVGTDGAVLVFDFERAGVEWWMHDIQRMWWNEWLVRPELAHRFFAGYGRGPTPAECALLDAASAAGMITQIVWATEHDDQAFAAAGRRNLELLRSGVAHPVLSSER